MQQFLWGLLLGALGRLLTIGIKLSFNLTYYHHLS